MRYRALDKNGDYVFGVRSPNFLSNSPAAVAQAIDTRLRLMQGEWLLDTEEGTPYLTEILGTNTLYTKDAAIKDRVLGTPGVASISNYFSSTESRDFKVALTAETIYGTAVVVSTITG